MLLWVSTLKSPMCNQKATPPSPTPARTHQDVGLKNLIYSSPNPRNTNSHIIHSHMRMMTSTLSPPLPPPSSTSSSSLSLRALTSSSSDYDDVIGAESGVNYMNSKEEEMFGLKQENQEPDPHHINNNSHGKRNHGRRSHCEKKQKKRELPPPMTPRLLTKYYCDGRLIIKDETFVNHHCCCHKNFEAIRENGRLTLKQIREEEERLHENDDNGDHHVLDHESISSYSFSSVPNDSYLWSGIERCDQDMRKCFTYSDAIMIQRFENKNNRSSLRR